MHNALNNNITHLITEFTSCCHVQAVQHQMHTIAVGNLKQLFTEQILVLLAFSTCCCTLYRLHPGFSGACFRNDMMWSSTLACFVFGWDIIIDSTQYTRTIWQIISL